MRRSYLRLQFVSDELDQLRMILLECPDQRCPVSSICDIDHMVCELGQHLRVQRVAFHCSRNSAGLAFTIWVTRVSDLGLRQEPTCIVDAIQQC